MVSYGDIDIDIKWGGVKIFFGREGLFFFKMSGRGIVFFLSFGVIYKKEFYNECFIIDIGYMVVFSEGFDFNVKCVGGFKSIFFSGEGFVVEFYGIGMFYI